MAYQTTNPFTGEVVATFDDATDSEVDALITRAHEAFLSWRETPASTRSELLAKAARLLRDEKSRYASILTLEMGKRTAEAEAEVDLSADILDYYAVNAAKLLEPEHVNVADPAEGDVVLEIEPQGIIFMVEPWNFPYYQIARVVAPQLVAGNVLILKHASNVPQAAAAFEQLMLDAGAPAGIFSNVYSTRAQTDRIIGDPRVRGAAFTGSEAAGRVIAETAAKYLKKSTLELGGADALIVLDDADLDKTAEWAVFGRFWNGGQVCVNSKRIIVVDSVYDEFLAKFRAGVDALVPGDPADPTTTLAPLSSQKAADDIAQMVTDAVAAGAKAETLGKPVPKTGAFIQPTILTDVSEENPAFRQEFFGPVAMIFRAKDEADAIRIANDSPFGLGGSVFTTDTERGKRVARQIDTGMVFVNHPTTVKADIPFGGVKHSGYGHELTDLGFSEFINKKVIGVVDINAPF